MKLPFQITQTYKTTRTKEEVMDFVGGLLKRERKVLFFSVNEYNGKVNEYSFKISKVSNMKSGPWHPKITGEITEIFPTTIELKITPSYSRIVVSILASLVFFFGVLLPDKMTINGVLREPEWYERFLFALFGGGFPAIYCYIACIRPVKNAELWITDKLRLINDH